MQTLRGRIVTYFLEEARGRAVTLEKLTKAIGEPTTTKGQDRVRQAVNNLKSRPEKSGLEIACDVRGAVWRQTNYVAPDPGPEPSPEPREIVAELEDDEPVEEHACPYAVVGLDAEGMPVVRDGKMRMYRLVAI